MLIVLISFIFEHQKHDRDDVTTAATDDNFTKLRRRKRILL